jgi:hypothetical protein
MCGGEGREIGSVRSAFSFFFFGDVLWDQGMSEDDCKWIEISMKRLGRYRVNHSIKRDVNYWMCVCRPIKWWMAGYEMILWRDSERES